MTSSSLAPSLPPSLLPFLNPIVSIMPSLPPSLPPSLAPGLDMVLLNHVFGFAVPYLLPSSTASRRRERREGGKLRSGHVVSVRGMKGLPTIHLSPSLPPSPLSLLPPFSLAPCPLPRPLRRDRLLPLLPATPPLPPLPPSLPPSVPPSSLPLYHY